jgi:SAM-dependent methyltransferase
VTWDRLGEWWLEEVDDPAYTEAVTPLLIEVLPSGPIDGVVLDLGSGDGRVALPAQPRLATRVVGVELNATLASRSTAPTVVARLPRIPVADGSVAGAFGVLILEHIDDLEGFFGETARVVAPGGFLAIVSNHPVWTAPGSTPIVDTDGEILWRPGRYFEPGATDEPAGEGHVTFYHRPMGMILEAAVASGWSLERMIERPHHQAGVDPGIPRLIGIRWSLRR